jgi:ubiquitin-protein ligase
MCALQMLREPSGASPLEPEIARQLDDNPAAFRETAAKWTADYAT